MFFFHRCERSRSCHGTSACTPCQSPPQPKPKPQPRPPIVVSPHLQVLTQYTRSGGIYPHSNFGFSNKIYILSCRRSIGNRLPPNFYASFAPARGPDFRLTCDDTTRPQAFLGRWHHRGYRLQHRRWLRQTLRIQSRPPFGVS